MSLLDLPIRVDREAERISTHNGGASCDFNGNEAQRREAMRFYEQAPRMARLLLKHLAGYGGHSCHTTPPECSVCGPIEECLRDAGVLEEARQTPVSGCAELCDFEPCRKAGECDG